MMKRPSLADVSVWTTSDEARVDSSVGGVALLRRRGTGKSVVGVRHFRRGLEWVLVWDGCSVAHVGGLLEDPTNLGFEGLSSSSQLREKQVLSRLYEEQRPPLASVILR
ncbi:hypothetical protein J5N97_009988 [Dioscorea zingiberensis]|uniref:Uncharacterized protein n=1 Tax=Dioscorea zingiberensis TaxID=325984 RepID=A0A9D5CYL5_9LILI|nr:hypothetical protein J5N97_009988 [Dioscorea zingiberensis]